MFKTRFLKLLGAITIMNILARLLGFARELAIGYQYGTSYHADGIITAFTIPNFLYVVIGGACTTALISVYSKLGSNTKDDFVQTIITYLTIMVGTITALFMIFPEFWMQLFFSGMSDEAMDLSSKLFLVTAPATLFLVVSMVLSGLHNVHENYRLSTFTSLIFNGSYFLLGLGLTPLLMEYSYALGATVGSASMFFILLYHIKKQNLMPLKFKITRLPELKRYLHLVLPLILGGATMQFYIIIQRIYASDLADGAIAAINYSSKMAQFPQGVLMISVTTIIYPLLAKAAGEGDFTRLHSAYEKGFRMLTLILLPASIFVFIYAKEIITVVFEYGNFSQESSNSTYPLLQVFSISVFSMALNTYVTRFFYAMENTLLPNILNIISVFGINIAVISLFLDELGASAIALGTVVSSVVNMLLLLAFAKRELGLKASTWKYILHLILYLVPMVILLWFISSWVTAHAFVSLLIGGAFTLVVMLGGLRLVK